MRGIAHGAAAPLVLLGLSLAAPGSLRAASCSPPLRPRIAEILYDAAGDDANREFVELRNPAAEAQSLAGAVLEVGDGSGPGRWTVRWTGSAGDSIAPLGRFVVGGALVEPAPDRVAELALQNGPDAVRLRWPDGAAEVVGYGALELAEYSCGAPAADAPSGQSLARIPDDSDEGSNALDFRPATPSPGVANQPVLDAALVRGSLALDPPRPDPLAAARLSLAIANQGARPIPSGGCRVVVAWTGAADTLAVGWISAAIAAGETTQVAIDLPGSPAGKRTLLARVSLPGDEAPANDADSLRLRIGPGPLEIAEIQFHPAAGEGEWVEVRNRDAAPFPSLGLALADSRGQGGRVEVDTWLPPDGRAVLAQDRDALLQRFPGLDSTRVWKVAPWSSLNNSNGEDGVADAVVLEESDGTPVERVDYSAAGVPAGVTLELRDGLWLPSFDPTGSPLAPPRVPPPAAGGFAVEPRRLAAGDPATLRWSLPWPRARASCEAYDLAGRKRGSLMAETLVPGRSERVASAALEPGLYVIVLRARPETGDDRLTVSRALFVAGAR